MSHRSTHGPRQGVRRWLRRAVAALAGLLLSTTLAVTSAGTSRAAPLGEYAGTLTFTVSTISPAVVTTATGNVLTVTGTMTNTGDTELSALDVRFQRGPAVTDVAAVQSELDDPGQPIAVLTSKVRLAGTIAAGASGPFSATIKIAGPGADSLEISDRGVYPIMLNVNADLGEDPDIFHARVGELHLLTTVVSVPVGAAPATGTTPGSTPAPPIATSTPIPISMLWPLVDRPHLGLQGVFLDDALTASISTGGRLSGLLDRLERTDLGPGAITLVVDPELLDELERMSAGYRVLAAIGRGQPALTATTGSTTTSGAGLSTRPTTAPGATETAPSSGAGPGQTPTSTAATAATAASGASNEPAGTVAGRGQAAAATFLRRLRGLAAAHPVLVLPYSDPDTVALAGAGMSRQIRALATKGRQIAVRVLGSPSVQLLTTTAYPAGGLIDQSAVTALAGAGYRTAVLDTSTVHTIGNLGAVDLGGPGLVDMKAAVNDSDLLAPITALAAPGAAPPAQGPAVQLNSLAALLAEHSFAGSPGALVLLPDRLWSATTWPGLGRVAALTRVFSAGRLLTGSTVDAIAARATVTGTVSLPADAPARLDPAELRRVQNDRDQLQQMRAALMQNDEGGTTGQPAPAELLATLEEGFSRVFSASLRTEQDGPGSAGAILFGVEATLASLRGGVTIQSGQSYTLASSSSPLLLTVQNALPYAVKIKVVISGGAPAGLQVTEPEQQLIPAGRSAQFRIMTRVSRSGTFPVQARLVGPDGAPWSPPIQISVSSSAYGVVTIVIITVAGTVLLLMVILRIVQRRRSRKSAPAEQARLAAEPAEAPTPDSIVGSAELEAQSELQVPYEQRAGEGVPHPEVGAGTAADSRAVAGRVVDEP